MEIIQMGDKSRANPPIRFACKKCGCIFECTKNECSIMFEDSIRYYYYECPTCETNIFVRTDEVWFDGGSYGL